ncbi:MAG: type II toxin-antitoxin system VapC family toxin [Desulfurellaceae bacterium]|nr:type II toxin-antitoxin system VapC family toxin [Desulfurellaceae bacterium]
MSTFVLNCSVTLAWLFQDEAGPDTDQLLKELRDDDRNAIVPNLWRLELGNTLTQAERRGRITAAQLATALELVRGLPITTDAETDNRAFREILNLARTTSLTTYDASYLELAMRHGVPLATLDKALIRAARGVAVKTLPA